MNFAASDLSEIYCRTYNILLAAIEMTNFVPYTCIAIWWKTLIFNCSCSIDGRTCIIILSRIWMSFMPIYRVDDIQFKCYRLYLGSFHFSRCTINPGENEGLVRYALDTYKFLSLGSQVNSLICILWCLCGEWINLWEDSVYGTTCARSLLFLKIIK
jgi:hypothetical protein